MQGKKAGSAYIPVVEVGLAEEGVTIGDDLSQIFDDLGFCGTVELCLRKAGGRRVVNQESIMRTL